MQVKIFTEGGSNIGLGHISRCSSLYDEIFDRGIEVELFIFGDFGEINLLGNRKYQNVDWLSADYLFDNLQDTDYSIVDSYLASAELCQLISKCSKRVLFIDDNARIRYPKGIVVNPSLSPYHLHYPIDPDNVYLLGSEYIILRNSFKNVCRDKINCKVENVLITMGGAAKHITTSIVNAICTKYPNVKFNVVMNALAALNIDSKLQDNVEVYNNVDAKLMLKLMLKSDLAITAAGQTIYELLATKTPFIPIETVTNQKTNVDGLRKINQSQRVLTFDDELFTLILKDEFAKMLDLRERNLFTKLYQGIIDGLGSQKIIDSLILE